MLKNLTHNGRVFANVRESDIKTLGIPEQVYFDALAIQKMENIRVKRDSLISDVDWTQTLDCPLSDEQKAEFAVYRQALRDIPQNFDDPDAVIWPEKPTL